ncbi:ATP synthase subunit I [Marinobacteraceae bacterium S3BR75-40.1]
MMTTINLLCALAGLGLGLFFYGGLWWTVRRTVEAARPAVLVLGSFVVRAGGVLAGFYWLGGDQWQRLVALLAGFVVARLVVTLLTRRAGTAARPMVTTPGKEDHVPES